MAAYEVLQAYFLAPNYYKEMGGAIADHTTDEDDLAINERGRPEVAWNTVDRGAILYSDAETFDALTDDQKAAATYVPSEDVLAFQAKLGAIKELELESKQQAAPAKRSGGRKPAEKTEE